MVVALREQQPKKSKLSLFRLGKPSTKSTASPPISHTVHDAFSNDFTSDEPSAPRRPSRDISSSTSRIVRSSRQATSDTMPDVVPVHVQYPQSADLSRNYDWDMTSEDQHDSARRYRRSRADSVPRKVHPVNTILAFPELSGPRSAPLPPQIRIDTSHTTKHSRQRSHFSIPDVIVTGCEEEGQEEIVEVQIPPNKRRSYILTEPAEERGRDHRITKKSSAGVVRRPTPLISFNSDEMRTMTRSGSDPSLSSNSTVSPTDASPTSYAGSSLPKGSMTKRSRKPSFPNIFGRKSLDSARSSGAGSAYTPEPLPVSPTTPTSAPIFGSDSYRPSQPDGLLFSSHDPSSSRSTFTQERSGLPSPPVTPTSPPRVPSKKELKAKAKEELALIKDLERVNKLVRLHDLKARKAQEKAQAKEQKRAAKLALVNEQYRRPSYENKSSPDTVSGGSSPSTPVLRIAKQTVFQASTKVSASKRTSIRSAAEVRGFAGARRGSEPTLSNAPEPSCNITAPMSVDLPASERFAFTQPRPAPHPQSSPTFAEKKLPSSPRESSPLPLHPSPLAPAPTNLADEASEAVGQDTLEGELSFNDDESHAWDRMSWSDFSSFASPLPSLVPSSSSTFAIAGRHDASPDEVQSRQIKRASVQRVLALSDAESGKRHSGADKRRSSHFDRHSLINSETGSKRSSTTTKRRSFIRSIAADEGWVVDEGQDDSMIAQPDHSISRWADWIEEGEVDRILAELRAAQADCSQQNGSQQTAERAESKLSNHAYRDARRTDSLASPTEMSGSSVSSHDTAESKSTAATSEGDEGGGAGGSKGVSRRFSPSVDEADKENCQPGDAGGKSDFRLSLALAPLQLQSLELFTGAEGRL
ncbi:hypothetical protein PSEUBRA_001454 [Kalmanozyma brasiliensis GHG001]|uniref:Uncharacterized protein n=1 Tax=Kalmanozyma brasiliensis (strain GHG001) TaxID=1365824 RepID=V5EYE7_KALBG|nr:uncharacterized protein PSEUBRA_001454 [Kalmanozyma brasiliensis GHG001]EST08758.1 hypothetical protein PSEUBRA_001454 [Kalmanozyma brasiliensis GHG001]